MAKTPEITKSNIDKINVDLRKAVKHNTPQTYPIIDEYKPLIYTIHEKSLFQIVFYLVRKAPEILKLLYYVLTLKDSVMTDKKTTIVATVKVAIRIIALILGIFAITIPESVEVAVPIVVLGIAEIFSWIQGLLSKDKDK